MGNKHSHRHRGSKAPTPVPPQTDDDDEQNDAPPPKPQTPSPSTAPATTPTPSPAPATTPTPSPAPKPTPAPTPKPAPVQNAQGKSAHDVISDKVKKFKEDELLDMIEKTPGFSLPEDDIVHKCRELTQWKEIDPHEDIGSCPICLCDLDSDVVLMSQCTGHHFHKTCIVNCFKDSFLKCPICNYIYGLKVGKMPHGTMVVTTHSHSEYPLGGYPSTVGTIKIVYNFPNGTQGPQHPHPGVAYAGTNRVCYLPNDEDGNRILKLLRIAWERKLTFTIGTSITTGVDNCVIWNGVHHKTALSGGPTNFGFPDETYFIRVEDELKDLGVVLGV